MSLRANDPAAVNGEPIPPALETVSFPGRWRTILGPAIVFIVSCSVFWVTTHVITLPPAWRTFEFCQYAEIGRNLSQEQTFDTLLVEPMALAVIDRDRVDKSAKRWPVVNRYPLPCLLIAGLMSLFGPGDTVAAWSNGLAIGLLAALSYALARTWYGPVWAAIVALLFLANPSFYGEFILLGTPDVWFATIFLAQLVVWSRFELGRDAPPRLGWAFCLGLLSGLAYLARFNATMFLAVQVAALLRWRRWRETLVLVMTTAIFTIPPMVYNWHHFHRPWVSVYSSWNLLDDIGAYQVEPWLYYHVPNLTVELANHAEGLARKFATNLLEVVPFRIWSLWRLELLLPLALVSVALGRRNDRVRRFSVWAVGFFVLQLVVFSAMRLELESRDSPHHGRYFFWFAAPALLLSVGTLQRFSQGIRLGRWLAGLIILLQLVGFGRSWSHMVPRHSGGTNLGLASDPIRSLLTQVASKDQVIASNQPQITAWFSHRKSISLPANPTELARLNRDSPTPIDYLFIDVNYNCIDLDQRWAELAEKDLRLGSVWAPELLNDYQYVLSPRLTRPLRYVLLRRRAIPPSDWERSFNRQQSQ